MTFVRVPCRFFLFVACPAGKPFKLIEFSSAAAVYFFFFEKARNLCCELGRASKSSLKTLTRQLRVGVGSSSKRVVAKRPDGSTYILQLGKNRWEREMRRRQR